MMWQDMVFLVGSMTSVIFLYPTLRDTAARVPRETSIPSMLIGGAYSFTFLTLGMTFSAAGSFAACTMWSLIAAFRAPDSSSLIDTSPIPDLDEMLAVLENQFESITGEDEQSTLDESTQSKSQFDSTAHREGHNGMDENIDAEFDMPANSD